MNWFYADGGQQAGPVDDAQFEQLARAGKIRPETLVWHEGMANWQPYGQINPGAAPAPGSAAAPADAVCAECGQVFNLQEMISFGTARVCAGCKPVFMQKLAEGAAMNPADLRYAGFWIRFAAKWVDGIILGIPLMVPFFFFVFSTAMTNPQRIGLGVNFGWQYLFQFVFMAANLAYSVFFLGKYGATPGKMLCKLRVIDASGAKISYGRATGRFFAEMLSGIICYIGYIMVGFDEEKRALHDRICNTRVVYK